MKKLPVTLDTEVTPNFFLILCRESPKRAVVFTVGQVGEFLDYIRNRRVYTFNGTYYDVPMLRGFAAGLDHAALKQLSDHIINDRPMPWDLPYPELELDHVDIMPILKGVYGLKTYGARIHSEWLQELPYHHTRRLTQSEAQETTNYCFVDTTETHRLAQCIQAQIRIRERTGEAYGVDVRSKSDAQMAEAVLKVQLRNHMGYLPKKPGLHGIERDFYYTPPSYVAFRRPELQQLLHDVQSEPFHVADTAKVVDRISRQLVLSPDLTVTIGVGGLHSCEKRRTLRGEWLDSDVASFYPGMILANRWYPKHLGPVFLDLYKVHVDARLHAKRLKQNAAGLSARELEDATAAADTGKIFINGIFGKFSEQHSIVFDPSMLAHVTITGQLSLLMLIEMLLDAGYRVVSANTDGVISDAPDDSPIFAEWESICGLMLEHTHYRQISSASVNDYIAIKSDGKLKLKGEFALDKDPWERHPNCDVSTHAAIAFMRHGTPIADIVRACRDMRQFIWLSSGKSQVYCDGEHVGKIIRWYYSTNRRGKALQTEAGSQVPNSLGAMPHMHLVPDVLPDDIDYDYYIQLAHNRLVSMGCAVNQDEIEAARAQCAVETAGMSTIKRNKVLREYAAILRLDDFKVLVDND